MARYNGKRTVGFRLQLLFYISTLTEIILLVLLQNETILKVNTARRHVEHNKSSNSANIMYRDISDPNRFPVCNLT